MKLLHLPCLCVLLTLVCDAGQTVRAQTADADQRQPWCTYQASPDGPGAGRHVVLISGDEEYRSEEALPMLGKILARRHGFRCTVLFAIDPATGQIDPNNQQNIPGMEHLETADLVILSLRFRSLPDEQMKFFDRYLMAGKPVIGLRTSTHAFRYQNDFETSYRQYSGSQQWRGGFGKQVLGETWVNHHGRHGSESTRGVINPDHADHVMLTGVEDVWGPTDVYGIRELPEGCQILLYGQVLAGMQPDSPPVEGEKNDPLMPLAWTRQWQTPSGNQVGIFCTTMGSSTDLESAGLRRLVINAAFALTGLSDEISQTLNVDYVDKYEPTNFGFNAFRKGRKPADYDLKNR